MNTAFALITLMAAAPEKKPVPEQYGWFTDYAKAQAEARRTGKPMLLVFRCDP